jgi:uncharacterized membrane protein
MGDVAVLLMFSAAGLLNGFIAEIAARARNEKRSGSLALFTIGIIFLIVAILKATDELA